MNFQQLEYFTTVAHFLSFSKAAKHLNIAQSAVSYGIANLEEELHVKLFFRDTRSVKITPAGAFFLTEVKEVVTRMHTAIEKARSIDAGLYGTLRVGFLSSVMKRHYSEYIPPFQEKYPSANLVIGQLPMSLLRESLLNGTIDIAITRSFEIDDVPELDYIKLYGQTCSFVFHKDHPLANMERIDYTALADEPFITLSSSVSINWYNKVLEICRNRGFTPNITQSPHSMEAVYNLLEFGMGVGIMPSSQNLYNMPNLKMFELNDGPDTHVDVVAAWNKNNINPIIPLFIHSLQDKDDK